MDAAAASRSRSSDLGCVRLGTSPRAVVTVRGRRPKLDVEASVGNASGACSFQPHTDLYVRARPQPARTCVQVTACGSNPTGLHDRMRRRTGFRLAGPADSFYISGAGGIPGTVNAHHTSNTSSGRTSRRHSIGVALRHIAVVEIIGARLARGTWIAVDRREPRTLSIGVGHRSGWRRDHSERTERDGIGRHESQPLRLSKDDFSARFSVNNQSLISCVELRADGVLRVRDEAAGDATHTATAATVSRCASK